jgi:acetate kinase
METVLVINSGSSSIKYQLVDPNSGDALASGLVEKIGQDNAIITHKVGDSKYEEITPILNHDEGLKLVLAKFDEFGPKIADSNVIACGHRVVQGGSVFTDSVKADAEVIKKIRELALLAPLHNGPNADGIEVGMNLLPNIPHIAVFDSAFFSKLPEEASTYPIDKAVAAKYQIKRYGAHGTSHKFVGDEVAKFLGKDREDVNQIVLHIGNGASISAQKGSIPIDTSMGLTPLEGLVMGTRSGDVDPAIVFHLIRNANMSVDEVDTLLNKQSGVLGLTGVSDMRELQAKEDAGEPDAILAKKVYCRRIAKYIGSYAVMLGKLDAITFTAGVGENDSATRTKTIEYLKPFGVELDEKLNSQRSSEPRIISTPGSKVKVIVFPTNEELAIAKIAKGFTK